jgi:hypothetical protein
MLPSHDATRLPDDCGRPPQRSQVANRGRVSPKRAAGSNLADPVRSRAGRNRRSEQNSRPEQAQRSSGMNDRSLIGSGGTARRWFRTTSTDPFRSKPPTTYQRTSRCPATSLGETRPRQLRVSERLGYLHKMLL